MAFDVISYKLSKKYTDETAIQFGGLKGAPCKVKSIVKSNKQNIITLEWKNDEGETRESKIYINDGTPIYTWEPNYSYEVGDLTIYASQFYRCIVSNEDAVFDASHWNEISSADGDYSIVETATSLPVTYTAADRKMYYVIDEGIFYLWNGSEWIAQPGGVDALKIVNTMPLNPEVNDIVLYNGVTTIDYIRGNTYIYKVKKTYYAWKRLDNIYYTLSPTPEKGDVIYSDTTGTETGYPIEEYDSINDQILFNDLIYDRDNLDDTDIYAWVSCNNIPIILNGVDKTGEKAEFYAPITSGQTGQFLQSQGEGKAPIWTDCKGYSPSIIGDDLIFVYGVIPEVSNTTLVLNL